MAVFHGIVRAETFRSLIEFMNELVSEVRVKADSEGWHIQFVEPVKIAAARITMHNYNWEYYSLEEPTEFGLDIQRLAARTKEGSLLSVFEELIDVKVTESEIRLSEGNLLNFGEILDRAEQGAFISISYNLLRDLIRTAIQDYLYLEADYDHITIYNGHLKVSTEEDYENIYEFRVRNPTKALYSIEYLKPLLKLKTDQFRIYFKGDTPCYIIAEVGRFRASQKTRKNTRRMHRRKSNSSMRQNSIYRSTRRVFFE